MQKIRQYGLGVLVALTAGLFLSGNGILLRLIEQADGWQILFYRGVALTTTLFVILLSRYRGNTARAFRQIGPRGVLAALALGFSSCCYVFALLLTTVANAMFIIGAAPLATAFAAWIFLGEKTSAPGIMMMLVALGGVSLLLVDGFTSGGASGNIAALGVVAGFVVYLLVVRNGRNVDMLPATCLSGLVMIAVGYIGSDHLSLLTNDLIIALVMGSVLITVGFAGYTIAARYLLAAEVALFALVESILAPLWVWIGVGETPSERTLWGSGIVVVAVSVYSLVEVSRQRRTMKALQAP